MHEKKNRGEIDICYDKIQNIAFDSILSCILYTHTYIIQYTFRRLCSSNMKNSTNNAFFSISMQTLLTFRSKRIRKREKKSAENMTKHTIIVNSVNNS